MKSNLKGWRFYYLKEIKGESQRVLRSITLEQFSKCLQNFKKRVKLYIESRGTILKISSLFYVYMLQINICELIPGTF